MRESDDTIAAIATPLGAGGLGIVRVSGPGALRLAAQVFQGTSSLGDAPTHTLHHGVFHDGAEPLDEVVAGLFRSPHSYTAEDVVEFSCHGGAQILRRVLDACLKNGARLAHPGEFTRRAFVNGKLDLAQAEAVADLIAARSDAQRRLALEALRGSLSHALHPLRERLVHLLAHVEANLDFVEDEVPVLSRQKLASEVDALKRDVGLFLQTTGRGRLWREGLRVVILGRPNVGKSSLFNALLQERRAIVADLPGTTRDTLEESVLWEGILVSLVDTAGLRTTDDPVEQEGADRARRSVDGADIALLVVEAVGAHPDDQEAARGLRGRPAVLVLNKSDAASPSLRENAVAQRRNSLGLPPGPSIAASAVKGTGLDQIRGDVLRLAGGGTEPQEPRLVLNARQEQGLIRAIDALGRASEASQRLRGGEETAARDLREALDRLNEVTGEGTPEEVLDAVFSRFCVGK